MKFKKTAFLDSLGRGSVFLGDGGGSVSGGVRGDQYDHILHIYICILVGQLGHSAKPLPFLASC